jgi:hypothetical protein
LVVVDVVLDLRADVGVAFSVLLVGLMGEVETTLSEEDDLSELEGFMTKDEDLNEVKLLIIVETFLEIEDFKELEDLNVITFVEEYRLVTLLLVLGRVFNVDDFVDDLRVETRLEAEDILIVDDTLMMVEELRKLDVESVVLG